MPVCIALLLKKALSRQKTMVEHCLERIDFNTWVTISIQRAIDKIHSHLSGGLASSSNCRFNCTLRGFIWYGLGHLSCVNRDWSIGSSIY